MKNLLTHLGIATCGLATLVMTALAITTTSNLTGFNLFTLSVWGVVPVGAGQALKHSLVINFTCASIYVIVINDDLLIMGGRYTSRFAEKMMTLQELKQSLDALHRANILIASVRKTFIAEHYVTGARVVHDAETRLADQILVLERMIAADVALKYKHLSICRPRRSSAAR